MATSFINDPEHWLQRAREARTLADQMSDEASKETMLPITGIWPKEPHYAHTAHRHNAQRAHRRRASYPCP